MWSWKSFCLLKTRGKRRNDAFFSSSSSEKSGRKVVMMLDLVRLSSWRRKKKKLFLKNIKPLVLLRAKDLFLSPERASRRKKKRELTWRNLNTACCKSEEQRVFSTFSPDFWGLEKGWRKAVFFRKKNFSLACWHQWGIRSGCIFGLCTWEGWQVSFEGQQECRSGD